VPSQRFKGRAVAAEAVGQKRSLVLGIPAKQVLLSKSANTMLSFAVSAVARCVCRNPITATTIAATIPTGIMNFHFQRGAIRSGGVPATASLSGPDPVGRTARFAVLEVRSESSSRLSRCRSIRISEACWYLKLRSFSRHLLMIHSSSEGNAGFRVVGGAGRALRMASWVNTRFFRAKGPLTCSGDM